ncbi:MAG TPA: thioredoxin family protein [Pseudonocardiaceae bacterium]|nr:thioredoxin family protein [Pseudonocardiaceae bacterium]
MTGLFALLGAVAVAGALAWWLRAREGRVRATGVPTPGTGLPEPVRAALVDGPAITLVQLSTTFCAPCRHARAVLHQLAGSTAGLAHVELDVTDRPEVAVSLGVSRTPTTVAFTSDGTELLRVGGVPKGATLIDALRPHLQKC